MAVDHGMNVAEIEQIGNKLQTHFAVRVQEMAAEIESVVGGTSGSWVGPDAERFRGWWPEKRSFMQRVADDLHGFGQAALNNVSEQRQASGERMEGGGVVRPPTPRQVTPVPGGLVEDHRVYDPDAQLRPGRFEFLYAPGGGGTKMFIPDDGGPWEVVEVVPNGAALPDDLVVTGEIQLIESPEQGDPPDSETDQGGYWHEFPDNEYTRKLGILYPGGGRIWISTRPPVEARGWPE